MQAIRTKYHGATDTKGSRISAKCQAKTIYLAYDSALDSDANHRKACNALRVVMNWLPSAGGACDSAMVGGWWDGCIIWVWKNEFLTTEESA